MPAPPKSKSTHVMVWNRGRVDGNGHYRAGNVILNYCDKGSDDRPISVIHPITVGLSMVPRVHWERALADAKSVGQKHMLMQMQKSGRLTEVDLSRLENAEEAADQTASKRMLLDLAAGKHGASPALQSHVADLLASWNKKTISTVRKITNHFASFDRAV